jgi:hypothetical protein
MAGGQRLISWLHPCSTSNVALNTRTCAHGPLVGHPNRAGCDIHPSSKNPTSSSVQLTRTVPTHTPCRVPPSQAHTHMHMSCTLTRANVQEPSLLAHDRTSSADPYAMPCVPSQAHTRHAPYVRTLTRTLNCEGRL